MSPGRAASAKSHGTGKREWTFIELPNNAVGGQTRTRSHACDHAHFTRTRTPPKTGHLPLFPSGGNESVGVLGSASRLTRTWRFFIGTHCVVTPHLRHPRTRIQPNNTKSENR